MKTFEKIYMREEAKNLYVKINKKFVEKKLGDDFFKDEMLKSILEVPSIIACGYEKSLKVGINENLLLAKSRVGRIKTLAYIGQDLEYFDENETEEIIGSASKIAGGIYNLINNTNKKEEK